MTHPNEEEAAAEQPSPPKGTLITIPLGQLDEGEDWQPRERMTAHKVHEYAGLINEGSMPPALLVAERRTEKGEQRWKIIDGRHRWQAMRYAGLGSTHLVEVRVVEVDEWNAYRLAVESNARHGVAFNSGDLSKAIRGLLDRAELLPEADRPSARGLARIVGCSHTLVNRIIAERRPPPPAPPPPPPPPPPPEVVAAPVETVSSPVPATIDPARDIRERIRPHLHRLLRGGVKTVEDPNDPGSSWRVGPVLAGLDEYGFGDLVELELGIQAALSAEKERRSRLQDRITCLKPTPLGPHLFKADDGRYVEAGPQTAWTWPLGNLSGLEQQVGEVETRRGPPPPEPIDDDEDQDQASDEQLVDRPAPAAPARGPAQRDLRELCSAGEISKGATGELYVSWPCSVDVLWKAVQEAQDGSRTRLFERERCAQVIREVNRLQHVAAAAGVPFYETHPQAAWSNKPGADYSGQAHTRIRLDDQRWAREPAVRLVVERTNSAGSYATTRATLSIPYLVQGDR